MSFLHHDAKVDRLAALPFFKEADRKALEHVASAADEVALHPGKVLITQGQHHSECFLVESGSLTVDVDGENVATVNAGEMVGELSLFGHGPASATVTVAEEGVALVIPYNRFDQILDEVPGLAKTIAIRLAERLHDMDARLHAASD